MAAKSGKFGCQIGCDAFYVSPSVLPEIIWKWWILAASLFPGNNGWLEGSPWEPNIGVDGFHFSPIFREAFDDIFQVLMDMILGPRFHRRFVRDTNLGISLALFKDLI